MATSDVVAPTLRLQGPVVAPFHEDGRFGPGHRGVDVRLGPADVVRSPVAGRVVFSGPVAGRRWVTLQPVDRVLVTVGPLSSSLVAEDDVVAVGTVLGQVGAAHGRPGTVHVSVRVDGRHVHPTVATPGLVAGLVPHRDRPVPGTASRPAFGRPASGAVPRSRVR